MLRRFLQALRPAPVCLFCAGPSGIDFDICEPCLALLPFNFHACRHCGVALAVPGELCGRCLARPPPFTRTLAPFHYAMPVSRLITGLKYQGRLHGARVLGTLMAEFVRGRTELPELLLPMPLHPRRLRQRGFNQAMELARPLAKILSLPLRDDVCRRVRDTPRQAALSKRERRDNLRGAFALTAPVRADHVAIIDDVMTTGSTARELTRVLLAGGVKRVDLWVVARAELSE